MGLGTVDRALLRVAGLCTVAGSCGIGTFRELGSAKSANSIQYWLYTTSAPFATHVPLGLEHARSKSYPLLYQGLQITHLICCAADTVVASGVLGVLRL